MDLKILCRVRPKAVCALIQVCNAGVSGWPGCVEEGLLAGELIDVNSFKKLAGWLSLEEGLLDFLLADS
jgi:hypothetical protein